jgi:hypothetical protein
MVDIEDIAEINKQIKFEVRQSLLKFYGFCSNNIHEILIIIFIIYPILALCEPDLRKPYVYMICIRLVLIIIGTITYTSNIDDRHLPSFAGSTIMPIIAMFNCGIRLLSVCVLIHLWGIYGIYDHNPYVLLTIGLSLYDLFLVMMILYIGIYTRTYAKIWFVVMITSLKLDHSDAKITKNYPNHGKTIACYICDGVILHNDAYTIDRCHHMHKKCIDLWAYYKYNCPCHDGTSNNDYAIFPSFGNRRNGGYGAIGYDSD